MCLRVCLSLYFLLSPALAQTIYQVQPGDSLSKIARIFNVSVDDLIAANQLANPNLIEVDQALTIPTLFSWSEPLPRPILSLKLTPQDATQGQVQILSIELEPGSQLNLSYLLKNLPSFQSGNNWIFLIPTAVLQPEGMTSLQLQATQTEASADLFLPLSILQGGYDRENINLSSETSQLLDPDTVNREHALLETRCSPFEPNPLWQGKFQYPVANPEFSSAFGTLRSYNNGPISGYHRGLDFRGETGTPVFAAASGTVSLAETLELYGNTVIINHGLGVCSAYMHLSELSVVQGQNVSVGEGIGKIGATGLVTGPHLHFEVRVNGTPVSPLQWFNEILW